jgi:DNA-3-methyladenine glycosylase II
MTTDYSHELALAHLSAADARLAALIARVGPCRLPERVSDHDPFESLVTAIASQQLSSKAAATIFGRVRALGVDGEGRLSPAVLLARPEADLRGAGLSGAKARYVRDLAERVHGGTLALGALREQSDEEVIATLTSVKGVGRWTAEMFLMFSLGRHDVLPVDDLGIQKGFVKLFALRKEPDKDRMAKLAKPFRPYRSIFCWYLWRLGDLTAMERKADGG